MNQKAQILDKIEKTYLGGKQLSKSELDHALQAIDSTDLAAALIGCTAILCNRDSSEEYAVKARNRLELICSDLTHRDDKCKIEVLFILSQIPIRELTSSLPMRELAYASARADRFTLRVNAVAILERLHKAGDSIATSLILNALNDTDARVRTNAEVALRQKI